MLLNEHVCNNSIIIAILFGLCHSILAFPSPKISIRRKEAFQEGKNPLLAIQKDGEVSITNIRPFKIPTINNKEIEKGKLCRSSNDGNQGPRSFLSGYRKIIVRRDLPTTKPPKKLDVSYKLH